MVGQKAGTGMWVARSLISLVDVEHDRWFDVLKVLTTMIKTDTETSAPALETRDIH